MSASLQDAHRDAGDSYSDSDSASDSLNIVNGNDEGWEDVEPEEEGQPVVGLFSADVYPDVRAMLKDTKERYNFDLVKVQRDLGVWSFVVLLVLHVLSVGHVGPFQLTQS
jgi:type I protein arginine methyltransferase